MLIYNPALDPYHAAVRTLAILRLIDRSSELESIQLIDLLLLYPSLLLNSRLPRTASPLRRMATARQNHYRQPPSSRLAVDSIKAIQAAAASTLAAAGVLNREEFRSGVLHVATPQLPTPLSDAVSSFLERDSLYVSRVVQELAFLPLRGPDGLKTRTKLSEYRYDAT